MKGKGLLVAFVLAVGLCLVSGQGHGEIPEEMLQEKALDIVVELLEARVDYMMDNPTSFLKVQILYDATGMAGRLFFDDLPRQVDTRGKIIVFVYDNREVFSYAKGPPKEFPGLENFPLPPDTEVVSEDKRGLVFWTRELTDSDQAFQFYGQWLSAEGWGRLFPDEAPWLETWSIVHQIWQKNEMTLVIFPAFQDGEGRLGIDVRVFIRPGVLLDEFRRELETIYKPISGIATDMGTDVVAKFERGITPLGYFYQGEYHLWGE